MLWVHRRADKASKKAGTAFLRKRQLRLQGRIAQRPESFCDNRPPYQQRTANVNVNGPSSSKQADRKRQRFPYTAGERRYHPRHNADRPLRVWGSLVRSPKRICLAAERISFRKHSLIFNTGFGRWEGKNQGIGGMTLPDRASTGRGKYSNFNIRQFSVISPPPSTKARFGMYKNYNDNIPSTSAIAINVLGNFNSGGAQNYNVNNRKQFNISNLFTRVGERLTTKAGFDTFYLKNNSISESNFLGSYTFSNMEDFLAGKAASFSVTRGNPLLEMSTLQWSLFIQQDLKLTSRLTAMFGMRYEAQKDVSDRNNFGPGGFRVRGKSIDGDPRRHGSYYQSYWDWMIQTQLRGDGQRQYDIVIEEPFYDPANPDPFKSGKLAASTPPSIRVIDPDFALPYEVFIISSWRRRSSTTSSSAVKYEHSLRRSPI